MKEKEHIINLSRITDQEVSDLNEILDYIEKLKEVDIKEVEVMSCPVDIVNVVREDESCNSGNQEEIINLFPDKEKKFLKVKSVF